MVRFDTVDIGMLAGLLLIYILPGIAWSYALYPAQHDRGGIEALISRGVLSIALSIVIVPLLIFVSNLFLDPGADLFTALAISLIATLLGAMGCYIQSKVAHKP